MFTHGYHMRTHVYLSLPHLLMFNFFHVYPHMFTFVFTCLPSLAPIFTSHLTPVCTYAYLSLPHVYHHLPHMCSYVVLSHINYFYTFICLLHIIVTRFWKIMQMTQQIFSSHKQHSILNFYPLLITINHQYLKLQV